MEPKGVERRLAAILAADVVGYTRLMEADEEGTLARLNALHRDLIEPIVGENRGQIVKLMGDGMLVEFASVVDAVRCSVEIQREIRARESGARGGECLARRMELAPRAGLPDPASDQLRVLGAEVDDQDASRLSAHSSRA